jgi:hypothetical protein
MTLPPPLSRARQVANQRLEAAILRPLASPIDSQTQRCFLRLSATGPNIKGVGAPMQQRLEANTVTSPAAAPRHQQWTGPRGYAPIEFLTHAFALIFFVL